MPSLPPNDLVVALQNLEALKIPKASKVALADILKAAANPHAEDITVIVNALDPARKKMVKKTAKDVSAITKDIMARGRAALEAMSDEEWDRLVDEANNEQD